MGDKSFWNSAPGPTFKHYFKSIFASTREPLLISNEPYIEIDSPKSTSYCPKRATIEDIPEIIKFWRDQFRRPLSPICQYDPEILERELTEENNILIIIRDLKRPDRRIIGTIMSKPMGPVKRVGISSSWSDFRLRWIDMFCVHVEKWHKGIGSALLHAINRANMEAGDFASIFMKEGEPLPLPALRTSSYKFRYVEATEPAVPRAIESWTTDQFLTYAESLPLNQKTQYIIHRPSESKSKIFAYRGFKGLAVAVFTKGHEIHYEDNRHIIWCSGLLKRGEFMDEEYRIALLSLSKAASDSLESPWIWMDSAHINEVGSKDWLQDGPYHIYSFNMDTGLYITCEPIIIL